MLDWQPSLINYEINIMTDQEDSERRQTEFKEKTENFVKNLELDETSWPVTCGRRFFIHRVI